MFFLFKKRCKSFGYAFEGLKTLIRTQPNARIHLIFTIGVVFAGYWFHISKEDWMWVVMSILVVWMAEAFNTAIEFLSNQVTQEIKPLIKKSKDVAAAAVLITSIGAACIGVMVFYQYIV